MSRAYSVDLRERVLDAVAAGSSVRRAAAGSGSPLPRLSAGSGAGGTPASGEARPSRDTIRDRVSIHERPGEVDDRSTLGHWEGDLIICQRTRPVLVLHERRTRLTLAARLTGKGAAETAGVIMSIFRRLDPGLRQSITPDHVRGRLFDNDTCFARHGWLREALEMTTWFCDAYASWQKGGVENANARLRRWLPRRTNLDDLTDEDLQEIVMTYNLTPRKCLGDLTPIQALFKDLGRDVTLRFA